ncbi:MAG: hypothetical protein IKU93_02760 [Alistipes sp.]|nr:hypothetical protein [Alistipes sp.]
MAKENKTKTEQPESITEIIVAAPEQETAPTETPVEEPVDAGMVEMPDGGELTLGIDSLREFVADKFGKQFDTDAELYAFIEEKLNELSTSDSMVGDILAEYPELYAIIQDLSEGKPFEVALAANVDVESLKPLEGEEMYAEYQAAHEARKDRKRKSDEYRETFSKNAEDSKQVISDFFSEVAFDEEQGVAFANKIDKMIADYVNGVVTREFLDVFYRAMNYEQAMESAREAGAIDAKNARIDAERERAEAETDGLPTGGSAVGVTMPEEIEEDDIFGEVKRKSRKNW